LKKREIQGKKTMGTRIQGGYDIGGVGPIDPDHAEGFQKGVQYFQFKKNPMRAAVLVFGVGRMAEA
jgi:hypothetical protein